MKGTVFKLSWVSLSLLALIGGFFTVATMPVSPAQGAACFSTKTTADGLGSDDVLGVYADGSNVYAATLSGLSISIDGGTSFPTTFTTVTAPAIGSNAVRGVYADGLNIYAATDGGLSISTNGGTSFTNKTTEDGLGSNAVSGVYDGVSAEDGLSVYAATTSGLSISRNGGARFPATFTASTEPAIGSDSVLGVYAVGSNVYAATTGGLSISTNEGNRFTNKTTEDGLGSNVVRGVYVDASEDLDLPIVYAATLSGLSISTNGGTSFTNKTTADGLGNNAVNGVYADGLNIYAATDGGLSISTDGGATFTTVTTPAIGSNNVKGVYADGLNIYAATEGGLSISADCVSSSGSSASPSATSASPGIPGIFLAVNEVLVGTPADGAPVYCGADAIQPNSTYSLSVQSVMNSALTRTVVAAGTVNSRGHLDERFELPALNPGTYKIVMTGTHRLGHLLVLTNYLTVGANGNIVSVSAESQQPFLN